MAREYVVVDGSNIATEGRSTPSLAQLDAAVRQFMADYPGTEVVVIVDATFGHRIDPAERRAFDEAVAHGELVSPPAGAVGRGDAFVLRVAERVNARVLSNDSFQEFHAEHPWLFDEGRLIGGKPVPGIGWIFTPRSPVRGPRSRAALAAKSAKAPTATVDATAVTETSHLSAADDGRAKQAKVRPAKKTAAAQQASDAKATKTAVVDEVRETRPAPKPQKVVSKAPKAVKAQKSKSVVSAKASQTGTKKQEATKPATPVKRAKAAVPAKAAKVQSAPPAKAEPTRAASVAEADAGDEDSVHAPSTGRSRRRRSRRATGPAVRAAIDAATVEAIASEGDAEAESGGDAKRRRRGQPPPAVNDPLTFLTFVSEHPIGSPVHGVVSSFASHGAMVDVEGMQCYAPLAGLGSPPPRRAREVLERGERRDFILVALDPPRRGAQLALPEVAAMSARPA
jgi:hypothetical protein